MADLEAKRVDVIVVYKVDRLTRSLADFARIVEVLDRQGVSFVSVTQAFNTTSSMGRLTLNVLLSFAQFEREVTGERIRDKIAASKRLGLWMGGMPPLGYRPVARTLVIEPDEAEQVRLIFRRYLELGSVHRLRDELAAAGVVSKRWVSAAGKAHGGHKMDRGALFHLLRNRLYLGEIRHKTASYPGQHPAIIEADLFEAVQARFDATAILLRPNRPAPSAKPHGGAPLMGLIFDAAGNRMSPVSARRKGGASYRYYVSQPLQRGTLAQALKAQTNAALAAPGVTTLPTASKGRRVLQRIPAGPVDALVLDRLQRIGIAADRSSVAGDGAEANWAAIRTILTRVEIGAQTVTLQLQPDFIAPTRGAGLTERLAPGDEVTSSEAGVRIIVPATFTRRSGGLVALNPAGGDAVHRTHQDRTLCSALIRAEAWKRRLLTGSAATVEDLARQEGLTASYVIRLVRVAFLAPDLKRAILDGTQPGSLNLQRLLTQNVPIDWQKQRTQLRD